jgi:hypothetical protein
VSPEAPNLPILNKHSFTVSESEEEALAEAKCQIDLLLSKL